MSEKQRKVYNVHDASLAGNVPKGAIYDAIRAGELEFILLSNTRHIFADQFRAWIEKIWRPRSRLKRHPEGIIDDAMTQIFEVVDSLDEHQKNRVLNYVLDAYTKTDRAAKPVVQKPKPFSYLKSVLEEIECDKLAKQSPVAVPGIEGYLGNWG